MVWIRSNIEGKEKLIKIDELHNQIPEASMDEIITQDEPKWFKKKTAKSYLIALCIVIVCIVTICFGIELFIKNSPKAMYFIAEHKNIKQNQEMWKQDVILNNLMGESPSVMLGNIKNEVHLKSKGTIEQENLLKQISQKEIEYEISNDKDSSKVEAKLNNQSKTLSILSLVYEDVLGINVDDSRAHISKNITINPELKDVLLNGIKKGNYSLSKNITQITSGRKTNSNKITISLSSKQIEKMYQSLFPMKGTGNRNETIEFPNGAKMDVYIDSKYQIIGRVLEMKVETEDDVKELTYTIRRNYKTNRVTLTLNVHSKNENNKKYVMSHVNQKNPKFNSQLKFSKKESTAAGEKEIFVRIDSNRSVSKVKDREVKVHTIIIDPKNKFEPYVLDAEYKVEAESEPYRNVFSTKAVVDVAVTFPKSKQYKPLIFSMDIFHTRRKENVISYY